MNHHRIAGFIFASLAGFASAARDEASHSVHLR